MTTLVLAYKRFSLPRLISSTLSEKLNFNFANGTAVLFAIIAFFIAIYLVALFISFSFGFNIQQQAIKQKGYVKNLRQAELAWQRKLDLLAEGKASQLESMERVSSIRYIRPENVAVSHTFLRP